MKPLNTNYSPIDEIIEDLHYLLGPGWVPDWDEKNATLNLYTTSSKYSLRINMDGTYEVFVPSEADMKRIGKVARQNDNS